MKYILRTKRSWSSFVVGTGVTILKLGERVTVATDEEMLIYWCWGDPGFSLWETGAGDTDLEWGKEKKCCGVGVALEVSLQSQWVVMCVYLFISPLHCMFLEAVISLFWKQWYAGSNKHILFQDVGF